MLSSARDERHSPLPRRPPRSLKQEYQEFILQRIEEYKERLPRAELLEIGDEAVHELEVTAQDQYLLTEVLLLEHVDRIIARRLRLPSFPRWRQKHRALREAQRQPTHWGLDTTHLVVRGAARLEPGDMVAVVGAAALPAALYVAAHDAEVILLDQDLHAVEAAESRAVSEQLGGRFQALVIQFGGWLPDVRPALVVVDPTALGGVRAQDRRALVSELQARTPPGGVHVILPVVASAEIIPLAPEALQPEYTGWSLEPRRRGSKAASARRAGFTATKPARREDTRANVSD